MIQHICPRCGKAIPTGQRCPCSATRYRDYNRFRRDSRIKAFRQSPEWKATRAEVIERDEGLDQYILYTRGEIVPGCSVHHITPIAEDWDKRLDRGNLITLSEVTHERIEWQYKHGNREQLEATLRYIVQQRESAARQDGRNGRG